MERLKSFAIDTEDRLSRLSSPKAAPISTAALIESVSEPPTTIEELPDDILGSIIEKLPSFSDVKSCCMVSRRFKSSLVENGTLWRGKCLQDYGLSDKKAVVSLVKDIAVVRAACSNPVRTSSPKDDAIADHQWFVLYRDLEMAWSKVVPQMLSFLSSRGHPSTLSGSHHRRTLSVVLSVLLWTTGDLIEDRERREVVRSADGIRSLGSLIDNNSANVKEKALGILANLCTGKSDKNHLSPFGGPSSEILVTLRNGANVLESLIRHAPEGVRYQAARLLVNAWSQDRTPKVDLISSVRPSFAQSMDPTTELRMTAELIEFSLRGEVDTSVFQIVVGSLDGKGRRCLNGVLREGGSPNTSDEFVIEGWIDKDEIFFVKTGLSLAVSDKTEFTGWIDGCGCFGIYFPVSNNSTFLNQKQSLPRVFRLVQKRV